MLRAPTEFIMMGHNLSIHLLLVGILVGSEIGRSVGWSIVLFIILHEYQQPVYTEPSHTRTRVRAMEAEKKLRWKEILTCVERRRL